MPQTVQQPFAPLYAIRPDPKFIVIDLFCGAGGVTTGFVQAKENEELLAYVFACINHDAKAIKSHWINHPDVEHFNEDITKLYGTVFSGILFKSNEFERLIRLVDLYRSFYPNAKIILWASLECTNFSKAKGGMSRDADSRTLAEHLDRYIVALQPDYIQIENVVEFMDWGPLDDNGKPIKHLKGVDFKRWNKEIDEIGYVHEWVQMNSANYGAYTSRNRLFGIFSRPGLPVVFPEATHEKVKGKKNKVSHTDKSKLPWKAVKEVLNFKDEGTSIFNRKSKRGKSKPLSERTLERIYAGLIKYIAKGDTSFLSKYYSGSPEDKNISVAGPADTVTTIDHHSLVQPEFLLQTYAADSTGHNTFSIDKPARTITTRDATHLVQPEFIVQRNSGKPNSKLVDIDGPARTLTATAGNQDLVQPIHLMHYYGSGGQFSSVEDPAPVIPTKARTALVTAEYFIDKQYSGTENHQSIDQPAGTIMVTDKHSLVEATYFIDRQFTEGTRNSSIEEPMGSILTVPKMSLVEAEPFIMPTNYNNQAKSIHEPSPVITANRKHHYLVSMQFNNSLTDTDRPHPTLLARMDKKPPYLVVTENGFLAIQINDNDSPCTKKIKEFMAAYGLIDIKMRMLRVLELLDIQGFPKGYHLEGNQADQKKFIGNSVVPLVVKLWTEALAFELDRLESLQAA